MVLEQSGWFAVDTESGGLDSKYNSLLTLSGIVVDDDLQPLAEPINLTIKHDIYCVTAKALEVNKINLVEHDKKGITLIEAGDKLSKYLLPFVDGKRLGFIGQNADHDKGFIINSGLLRSWDRFFNREVLDTKRIAGFLKFSGRLPKDTNTTLKGLATHLGISTEKHHEAEFDLWMTLQVLDKLRKLDKRRLK